jgi:hypothetical protein
MALTSKEADEFVLESDYLDLPQEKTNEVAFKVPQLDIRRLTALLLGYRSEIGTDLEYRHQGTSQPFSVPLPPSDSRISAALTAYFLAMDQAAFSNVTCEAGTFSGNIFTFVSDGEPDLRNSVRMWNATVIPVTGMMRMEVKTRSRITQAVDSFGHSLPAQKIQDLFSITELASISAQGESPHFNIHEAIPLKSPALVNK